MRVAAQCKGAVDCQPEGYCQPKSRETEFGPQQAENPVFLKNVGPLWGKNRFLKKKTADSSLETLDIPGGGGRTRTADQVGASSW